MTYTTGNPDRDHFIENAILKCERRGQTPDLASVTARLPKGFELDAAELSGIIGNRVEPVEPVEVPNAELASDPISGMTRARAPSLRDTWPPKSVSVPVEEPRPETLEKIEAPHANGAEPPHVDTAEATPRPEITHAMALANVNAWKNKLAEDRITVREAQERVKAARGELHAAVVAFQSGDGLTPEQRRLAQVRAFTATSQAQRAALAKAREAAGLPATGTSETARAYVAKRMMYGPSRGGMTNAQRARYGMKLPQGNPLTPGRGAVPLKTGS